MPYQAEENMQPAEVAKLSSHKKKSITQPAPIYIFLHSKCQAKAKKGLQSSSHDAKYGPNLSLDPDRLLPSLPKIYKDLQEYLFTNFEIFPTWLDDFKRFIAVAFEAQPPDIKKRGARLS